MVIHTDFSCQDLPSHLNCVASCYNTLHLKAVRKPLVAIILSANDRNLALANMTNSANDNYMMTRPHQILMLVGLHAQRKIEMRHLTTDRHQSNVQLYRQRNRSIHVHVPVTVVCFRIW